MDSPSKIAQENVDPNPNPDAETAKIVEGNDPKPADDFEESIYIAGAALILLGLIRDIRPENVPADGKVTALEGVIPAISWIIAFITMYICLVFMIHHKKSWYRPLSILALIAVWVYYMLVLVVGIIQHLK